MSSLLTIVRRLISVSLALAFLNSAAAAEPPAFAQVRAADAARIAATLERNTTSLAPLLSDDLIYTNADGRVQTKSQYLASVAESDARYVAVHPRAVQLQLLHPGAVVMTGHSDILAETAGQRVRFSLRFLAVWRDESGRWKLAAYQSTPIASPASSP